MGNDVDKSLFTVRDENGKVNLFAISVPLFLQLIMQNVLSMINTATFSRYDENLVTALSACTPIINFAFSLATVVAFGLSILLSHSLGKNDTHAIKNAGINALLFTAALSLTVVAVAAPLSGPLLGIMNLGGTTLRWAKIYFIVQLFSAVFISAINTVFSTMLRCYGKVFYVVIITIGISALSAVNLQLFVRTPLGGHLDMIYNVCINAVLLMSLQCGLLFLAVKLNKVPIGKKVDGGLVGRMFRVGLPASISNISYSLSTMLTTSIISGLDTAYINVKLYCDTIFNFVSYFGNSIGSSGGVLIGRVVGAGNYAKAKRMHRVYLLSIVGIDFTLAVLALVLHRPLYGIFDSSSTHLTLIAGIFAFDILVEAGRGVNHACQNSLNGVGDVRYTTIVSVSSCWIMAVLMSYVFAVVLGLGLIGCWIAFALDEWLRAALYLIRWYSGKWQNKKI